MTKQKHRQSYDSEGKLLSKQYKNGNTQLCFRFIPNASGLKVYKHPGSSHIVIYTNSSTCLIQSSSQKKNMKNPPTFSPSFANCSSNWQNKT